MAMRYVAVACNLRLLTVSRLADSVRTSTAVATRAFSDGKGKVLSEEELAAEKIYIQKMEKEKLEKLKHKAEKEKAEKEKDAGKKEAYHLLTKAGQRSVLSVSVCAKINSCLSRGFSNYNGV